VLLERNIFFARPVMFPASHASLPQSPFGHILTPSVFPKESVTTQEMQLSGACDWYKISKLIQAENKLISRLEKYDLEDDMVKLIDMRDDVIVHRIANSPFTSAKAFLRNNCANDVYIAKWRHDIDKYAHDLHNSLVQKKIEPSRAIELQFMADSLKQQARASLPYTGYYNPVPKAPSVPEGTIKELPYVPEYTLEQVARSGIPEASMFPFFPVTRNLMTTFL
jgi:hypothetical protein